MQNGTQYITIIAEIYNHSNVEGTEWLTYNVRVATDIEDYDPKYSYMVSSKSKAVSLAEKIHNDQRTADIVYLYA